MMKLDMGIIQLLLKRFLMLRLQIFEELLVFIIIFTVAS